MSEVGGTKGVKSIPSEKYIQLLQEVELVARDPPALSISSHLMEVNVNSAMIMISLYVKLLNADYL